MIGTVESQIDAVWQEVQEQFGGKTYECASGEFNTALLVDSNPEQTRASYVVKVPHDDTSLERQRLAYEAKVIRKIHNSAQTPPVHVPPLLGESVGTHGPAWAAFSYVPGHVFTYRDIHENLSEQELLDFGHKVGEVILWLSKAITLDDYRRELNPPPPCDRENRFRQVGRAALTLDRNSYPSLRRMTDAQLDDFKWFHKAGILRPCIVGHDDIRPGNLAFTRIRGKWRFTGLFDFGMTAPSTPEREARHVRLLGGFASHFTLGAYYGIHNPHIDGPLIPGTEHFAETVTNFWAYAQALTNGMWRLKLGSPLGSVPVKLDQLFANAFDWSELEVVPDMSQIDLLTQIESGMN